MAEWYKLKLLQVADGPPLVAEWYKLKLRQVADGPQQVAEWFKLVQVADGPQQVAELSEDDVVVRNPVRYQATAAMNLFLQQLLHRM